MKLGNTSSTSVGLSDGGITLFLASLGTNFKTKHKMLSIVFLVCPEGSVWAGNQEINNEQQISPPLLSSVQFQYKALCRCNSSKEKAIFHHCHKVFHGGKKESQFISRIQCEPRATHAPDFHETNSLGSLTLRFPG